MYFPVYIDLSGRDILIVGAGTIAARRIRTLCGFADHMTVVAPVIREEITELADHYPITLCLREFRVEDLQGKSLVLAATNDRELNRQIWRQCKAQQIPVNVCSDQSLCDFQFPSIVCDGDVVIGINASGRDHSLVKKTRQKLEQLLQVKEEEKKYKETEEIV
jgi:siroheme synthase-like protein